MVGAGIISLSTNLPVLLTFLYYYPAHSITHSITLITPLIQVNPFAISFLNHLLKASKDESDGHRLHFAVLHDLMLYFLGVMQSCNRHNNKYR